MSHAKDGPWEAEASGSVGTEMERKIAGSKGLWKPIDQKEGHVASKKKKKAAPSLNSSSSDASSETLVNVKHSRKKSKKRRRVSSSSSFSSDEENSKDDRSRKDLLKSLCTSILTIPTVVSECQKRKTNLEETCFYCGENHFPKTKMESHVMLKHRKARFGCLLCDTSVEQSASTSSNNPLKFDYYDDVRQHLLNVHSIIADPNDNEDICESLISIPAICYLKIHSCLLCKTSFISETETVLLEHLKSTHKTEVFLASFFKRCCRLCGVSCQSDGKLEEHIRVNHPRSGRFWKEKESSTSEGCLFDDSYDSSLIASQRKVNGSFQPIKHNEVKTSIINQLASNKNDSSGESSSSSEESVKVTKKRRRKSKRRKKSRKKQKRVKKTSSSESDEGEVLIEKDDSILNSTNANVLSSNRPDLITESNHDFSISHPRKSELKILANPVEKDQASESDNASSSYCAQSHSIHLERSHDGSRERSRERYREQSDDSESNRKHERRRAYSDSDHCERSHKARHENEFSNRGGFCEECQAQFPGGKYREHCNGDMHRGNNRGKLRCFLCNKPMSNAISHLETFHANDTFKCNVRQCPNPKFVEAKKIMDHLDRNHCSITQGKTREQLIRGRYLVLPKNLEVMECRFCGTEYKGQPVETVLRHIEDQCGLKDAKHSHIIFSCRLCGPRRLFDSLEKLIFHCRNHQETAHEEKFFNDDTWGSRSPLNKFRRHWTESRSRSRSRSRTRSHSRSRSRERRSGSLTLDMSYHDKESIYMCYFCNFTSFKSESRDEHVQNMHSEMLFACLKCPEESVMRFVNKSDLYEHLKVNHQVGKNSEEEDLLEKFTLHPNDLRKILCLECNENDSISNAQWLCKDPHEVICDLKDHLLNNHKNRRVVSQSFGLRCSGCLVTFDYTKECEWLQHVKSAHNVKVSLQSNLSLTTKADGSRCSFCNKENKPGHVFSNHSELLFKCKICSDMDEQNQFENGQVFSQHCREVHIIPDALKSLQEYAIIPDNLICIECRLCEKYFYSQTMQDMDVHFKETHKKIINFKFHVDFMCRICMSQEKFITLEHLFKHLDIQHQDLHQSFEVREEPDALDNSYSENSKDLESCQRKIPICPYCNKNLETDLSPPISFNTAIQNHIEYCHPTSLSFCCNICDGKRIFILRDQIEKHLQEEHFYKKENLKTAKDLYQIPKDLRSFQCLKCFQMFLSQDFYTGGLLPHIRLAHSEDTACGRVRLMVIQDKALISQKLVEIRCRACSEIFDNLKSLSDHMQLHLIPMSPSENY